MTRNELIEQIKIKKSFLCVGLDPDMEKIPSHIKETADDVIFEFNKQIIDATAPYCVSYKPNNAFYDMAFSMERCLLEVLPSGDPRGHASAVQRRRLSDHRGFLRTIC